MSMAATRLRLATKNADFTFLRIRVRRDDAYTHLLMLPLLPLLSSKNVIKSISSCSTNIP